MTSPTKEVHQFYDYYRTTDASSYRFGKRLGDLSHRADRDDSKMLAGESIMKKCHCYHLFQCISLLSSVGMHQCVLKLSLLLFGIANNINGKLFRLLWVYCEGMDSQFNTNSNL